MSAKQPTVSDSIGTQSPAFTPEFWNGLSDTIDQREDN